MVEYIDNITKRYVDTFYLLLLHSDRYSHLPELYEVFGKEATIKFLNLFSGSTFVIPPARDFERIARDVSIYIRVSTSSTPDGRAAIVTELAREYQITESEVRKLYNLMRDIIASYDIRKVGHDTSAEDI